MIETYFSSSIPGPSRTTIGYMLNIMMLCICTSIASQTHNHTVVPTHFVVLRLDDDDGLLLAYMDLKSQLMTAAPPKIFPRVTGTKFFTTKSHCDLRERQA